MELQAQTLILNDKVAAVPFPSLALQVKTKGAFATAQQRNGVMKTTVRFPVAATASHPEFAEGDEIVVDGNDMSHIWAKLKFEINGVEVILIPKANVLAIVKQVK